MKDDNEILDMPEARRERRKEFFVLRFVSIALVAYGLTADMVGWPGHLFGLISGVSLWTFWNFLQYFSRKSPEFWESAYFGGRFMLAVALFLQFFGQQGYAFYTFGGAALSFIFGYFASSRSN